jgi:hypothetical protein
MIHSLRLALGGRSIEPGVARAGPARFARSQPGGFIFASAQNVVAVLRPLASIATRCDHRSSAARRHGRGTLIPEESRTTASWSFNGASWYRRRSSGAPVAKHSGERWRKLRCDLVERPVPRRDETAHTNRLPENEGVAHEPLELVSFQNRNHLLEMSQRVDGLHLVGEGDGRAHLGRHGARQFATSRLETLDDPSQQAEPLSAGGRRIGWESPSRGGNCLVHRPPFIRRKSCRDGSAA